MIKEDENKTIKCINDKNSRLSVLNFQINDLDNKRNIELGKPSRQ